MISNQKMWAKAEEEVSFDLQHYMSLHDAKERLFELCEIALFPNDDLQTRKMSKEQRYDLMAKKVLEWFDYEVDKRAGEMLHG